MFCRALVLSILSLSILGTGQFSVAQAVPTPYPSYVENGTLYSATANNDSLQKTADNVSRILDQKPQKNSVLYLTNSDKGSTDATPGGDLFLLKTDSQITYAVAQNVVSAVLSADAANVAFWNTEHKVRIVTSDNMPLREIEGHAAAPIFSHDGNLVAYQKLADYSPDGDPHGLFESAKGIAIYDLRTGRDRLVTTGGMDDFEPVGFSLDKTKLYFNSTRPSEKSPQAHVASLWVVDLRNGKTTRLTNIKQADGHSSDELTPIVSQSAIWSSDHKTVISSNNSKEGVWIFNLSENGGLTSAVQMGDGDSPQWVVPDKSVVFRTLTDGKNTWRQVNLR
jgi:Tol biopolymer transport system component